jgi:hypothetical protein
VPPDGRNYPRDAANQIEESSDHRESPISMGGRMDVYHRHHNIVGRYQELQ